jgi:hypothetical protein
MVAAALLTAAACGHNPSGTSNTTDATDSTVVAPDGKDGHLELPLPEVPVALTEPKDRAAFVLYHFWDALDFRDTLRSHNKDLLEQNFANYLTLFSVADTAEVERAIEHFTEAARVDTAAYRKVRKVVYKYLYDPNSPMLNEDYYALFVRNFLKDASLDVATVERYKFDLMCIAKNRCGSMATDITYVDRDGRKNTLLRTKYTGKLMLIFYDPDCDECKETLAALSQNETLNQWIADRRVTVLAVCTEGEKSAWQQHLASMPNNWTVAFDVSGVNEKNSYILRAMPTIYILDETHRILGKDVPAQQALQILE